MSFGELLRRYRTEAGFSQEHLAAEARLSVESVSALERGVRRAPHRHTLALLASALGLDAGRRAELEAAANRARARTRAARDGVPASRVSTLQLPVQTTSLIGREQDITTVAGLLEQNRLVTITGSGGVGKTRVAIEVARRSAARWEDIRYIDLSPLTDATFISGAIVSPLAGSGNGSVNDVAAALRSTKALLVLDNCEHLIVAVARLVDVVLQCCRDITLLCTSRERLSISGEVVYRLPSLEVPHLAPSSLNEALRYAGIELFVQRATSTDRAVVFTDASAAGIAEISRRLDGIPLAIKLAAARVATLGLEPLRARLRDGLPLTGGARNFPARQQTMNATIAWSYDLLAESERLLL